MSVWNIRWGLCVCYLEAPQVCGGVFVWVCVCGPQKRDRARGKGRSPHVHSLVEQRLVSVHEKPSTSSLPRTTKCLSRREKRGRSEYFLITHTHIHAHTHTQFSKQISSVCQLLLFFHQFFHIQKKITRGNKRKHQIISSSKPTCLWKIYYTKPYNWLCHSLQQ